MIWQVFCAHVFVLLEGVGAYVRLLCSWIVVLAGYPKRKGFQGKCSKRLESHQGPFKLALRRWETRRLTSLSLLEFFPFFRFWRETDRVATKHLHSSATCNLCCMCAIGWCLSCGASDCARSCAPVTLKATVFSESRFGTSR
jgi:hypothetical protein